jgi:FkbM family methyltransferase
MATKLAKMLRKNWRILTDPGYRAFRREVKRFFREKGRGTPGQYDGLTPASIAFDLGGYKGEWTRHMRETYDCQVHVFEPHPAFAAAIAARFAGDPKVTAHACALGAAEGTMALSDSADASSAFSGDGPQVHGRVCAATDILAALGDADIDATKINIEGGEYEILPHLIETGLINRFRTITVQFHNFTPQDADRRAAIRAALAATHDCVWNYEFVWEEWRRKG